MLEQIALEQRGLILVTGTTGSGKSTTLAAMIEHINANRTCHIMTIEDPIEFLIRDKRSIVNQREVGVDTPSFANALRRALRQDPDVILVGEMRDLETIETALTAAETGHLVMSRCTRSTRPRRSTASSRCSRRTSRSRSASSSASILRAVVSQRLVPRADGKGRVRRARDARDHGARARVHRRQGPHQGDPRRDRQGLHDLRHADLRPVADVPREEGPRHLRGGAASTSRTPTTSRCASAASRPPPTAAGTTSRTRKPRRRPRPRRKTAPAAAGSADDEFIQRF